MIKLCIITTIPNTIKAFFGQQLCFLQEHGFEITVITSGRYNPNEDFGGDFPEGVHVKKVMMGRAIKPFEDIKVFIKITFILLRGHYDIVQYATSKASLFGSIGAWLARCPVRLYLMWGLYYVTQKGFKRHLFKAVDKLICSLSTSITSDSKGNVQFAIAEGLCKADKIQVIGHGSANGVDVERFDPERCAEYRNKIRDELKIPREAKVFGFIAAIVADKGINEMISAFVRLAEEYPDVYLLLIGRTTEMDPAMAATLN
jgi:glycosyltransferase involved in cell wall biosynthesis